MGVGNHLVSAANTFFASAPPGSDFLVANAPVGGHRAHIFGANNFDTLTLAQIQEIRGTLSFTTQRYAWGRVSVNLSSVSDSCSGKTPNDCYDQAASVLQTQINADQPTNIATFMGSIAPGSCSYTGSIKGGVMNVTVAPTACVYIGGTVTGGGSGGRVVAQQIGTANGAGLYNVFCAPSGMNSVVVPAGTTLTETYGILTAGSVTGTIAIGNQIPFTTGGPKDTYIHQQIGGTTGGAGTYIVNKSQMVIPSEVMGTSPALMNVSYHAIAGATFSSGALWLQQNSDPTPPLRSLRFRRGPPPRRWAGRTPQFRRHTLRRCTKAQGRH